MWEARRGRDKRDKEKEGFNGEEKEIGKGCSRKRGREGGVLVGGGERGRIAGYGRREGEDRRIGRGERERITG